MKKHKRKFSIKQHVWITNNKGESEVGVVAEYEQYHIDEEPMYMIMLHDKNNKMYFEEFSESELELVNI